MQIRSAAAVLLLLALTSCASAPGKPTATEARAQVRDAMGILTTDSYADTQALDVLYATTREPGSGGANCSDTGFGISHSPETRYGSCRVNVPKRHVTGQIEPAPNVRADTHRYFRVLGHSALAGEDGFVEALKARGAHQILVFIHGFNVKFEEAVLRAAQIAYDLKFQGPVVLFSWPAGAGSGFFGSTLLNRTYETNRAAAAASVPQLAALFRALAKLDAPAQLLVHSMGHQVALPALGATAKEVSKKFVGELVLNAPDIDVAEFLALVPAAKQLAQRVTVYCSFNDNAIAASETLNRGRRMGGCEHVPGVDVINAGEIDAPALGLGHGYYASRAILTDVYQLLLGIEAEKRLFVRKSEPNSVENFYLRP